MVVIVFYNFGIKSWSISGPYTSKEEAEYFFKQLPPKVQAVAEIVFVKQLAMALKLHEKLPRTKNAAEQYSEHLHRFQGGKIGEAPPYGL